MLSWLHKWRTVFISTYIYKDTDFLHNVYYNWMKKYKVPIKVIYIVSTVYKAGITLKT